MSPTRIQSYVPNEDSSHMSPTRTPVICTQRRLQSYAPNEESSHMCPTRTPVICANEDCSHISPTRTPVICANEESSHMCPTRTPVICAQRGLQSYAPNENSSHMSPARIQISLCIRCPHKETLYPWLSKMRSVKILIRLRECAGLSESSLGAHVRR